MRLGHLTDVHLNGMLARLERLRSALVSAHAAGCDHLAITGDLTADGSDERLSELGEAIWGAGWNPWQVTVVPGNHDARRDGERWEATLRRLGALRPLQFTSGPGCCAERRDGAGQALRVLALDTTWIGQPLALRARGRVTSEALDDLRVHGRAAAHSGVPLAVCMHHGPQRDPLQPVMGLQNRAAVLDVMRLEAPTAVVLCGHDHRTLDLWSGRIHVAPAVVECANPLRVYDARGAGLVPA